MFKFVTILFIQVLCGMELDLFIPSFPELQNVFSLSPVMVQLTISANFVAFCICSLFAGALGDRYNRRTILILGLCIFVIGSFLCVTAPNYFLLIMGRILQGIGISAPAILSFPVLLEDCSRDKQAGMMGMINGVKTLAMAIAPVMGSFVNLYFSWRGNFSILLVMGVLCLVASYFSIPSKAGDRNVSLSLKTYVPLLKSQKFLMVLFGVSLLTSPYWLFMGMAPIFYMEGMAVPLDHFGYYQGSLSLTFALVCVLSPKILKTFGQKWCLYFGYGICFLSAVLIMGLALLQINQPFAITAVLLLLSVGIVFPINILYPFYLEILPHTKGRSAGLGQSVVLLLTASLLELVAYFYNGQFMPIGLTMFISMMLSIILIQRVMKEKWLVV
ncbi:MAG: MFS transporter [Proteobacteria bacterium]|nr:MFS transporter [Pseudomonadota bacterium]